MAEAPKGLLSPAVGTPSQADKIISKYADLDGLTAAECADVGFDEDHCRVLTRVLGEGKEGVVTNEERNLIWNSGFSGYFLYELAGRDSKKGEDSRHALERRVAWLADHAGTALFRRDRLERRVEAIRKLASMGPLADAAIPALTGLLEDEEREIRQASAVALGVIGGSNRTPASALVRKLVEWPSEDRPAAAGAIARLGAIAVDPLISALVDDEPQLLQLVMQLLGRVGRPAAPAVPRVLKILSNPDTPWQLQNEAAVTLGNIGDPRAIPSLIDSLENPNDLVARAAAWALIQIDQIDQIGQNGSASLIPLVQKLNEPPGQPPRPRRDAARRLAAWAIGMLHPDDEAAVDALVGVLDDPAVQYEAGVALKRIGEPALVALVSALLSRDPDVRRQAAWVIGEIGPGSRMMENIVALELRPLLQDDEEMVRIKVAEALEKLAPVAGSAAPDLVIALADPSEHVRKPAAAALAALGARAPEALVKALGHRQPFVQQTVFQLLVKIGGPAVPSLAAIVSGAREGPVELASKTLVAIGPSAVSGLVPLTRHPKAEIRDRAVRILGEIAPVTPEAIAAVLERLRQDPEPSVQLASADALASMGDPALPGVLAASTHPQARIRLLACRTLAPMKGVDSIGALADRVGDPNRAVRQTAIDSLVGKGEEAVESLITLLGDPQERYWRGAMEALVRIGPPSVRPLIHAMRDYESLWKERAAETLVQLKGTAVTTLTLGWTDPHGTPDLHRRVDSIFARIGEPAIPTLENYLGRGREVVRLHAAISLGLMGRRASSSSQRLFEAGAREQNRAVQEAEAEAIVRIGRMKARELAMKLLATRTEEAAGIRRFAVLTIGKMGRAGTPARPLLIEAVGDPGAGVHQEAEIALKRVGPLDPDDWMAVSELLGSGSPLVRIRAAVEIRGLVTTHPGLRDELESEGELITRLERMSAEDEDQAAREAAAATLEAIIE